MSTTRTSVPVLDLSTARNSDGFFNMDFIDSLRDAAHNVGFFQIINYGAADGQVEALLETVAGFFRLPLEQRLELDNRTSAQFRGYTRLGKEITRGRADSREQIDFGPDRKPLIDVPDDQLFLRLQGHNQWPAQYPELERTALAWTALMARIGVDLLEGISVALGLPENYLAEPFTF